MNKKKPMPRPGPKLRLTCLPGKQQRYHTFEDLPHRYNDLDMSATEIAGDSLEKDGIPKGYMVAVVNGGAVSSGDLAAVKVSDEPEGQLVRYVFFGPGGWIRLQTADREQYPDLIYTPDQFEIIGPVVHAEPVSPRWKQAAGTKGVLSNV